MADEEDQENKEKADEESGGSGGGKKKIILIAIIGLVLIGVSIGGTLAVVTLFGGGNSAEVELEEDAEPEPTPPSQAIYFPIKPEIIVNFEARGRQRFLQVDVTLLTREPDVVSAVELHMPMIRNALNLTLSGQVYEDIQTAEGKEFVRLECLQALRNIMEKEIGKPGIEQVLFTNMVMQ